MPNEFIVKNGLISQGSSSITGSLLVSGTIQSTTGGIRFPDGSTLTSSNGVGGGGGVSSAEVSASFAKLVGNNSFNGNQTITGALNVNSNSGRINLTGPSGDEAVDINMSDTSGNKSNLALFTAGGFGKPSIALIEGPRGSGTYVGGIIGSNNETFGNANGISLGSPGKDIGFRNINTSTLLAKITSAGVFQSNQSNGNDAIYFANNGARLHLGAGASDYLYSDGTRVRTNGDFYASSTISSSIGLHTTLTGSTVTGSTAQFTTISASVISASQYIGTGSNVTSFNAGTNLSSSGTTGNITVALSSSISSGLTSITGLTNLSSTNITGAAISGTNNLIVGGNVGIGTTNPSSKLELSTTGSTELRISSTGAPGLGQVSFYSDRGLANEWRPAYFKVADFGNFSGRLDFYTNGTSSTNKTGSVFGGTFVDGKFGVGNYLLDIMATNSYMPQEEITVLTAKNSNSASISLINSNTKLKLSSYWKPQSGTGPSIVPEVRSAVIQASNFNEQTASNLSIYAQDINNAAVSGTYKFYTFNDSGSLVRLGISGDGNVSIGDSSTARLTVGYDGLQDYASPFVRFSNTDSLGQIPVEFYISGGVRGKIRSDYAGNMTYVASGSDPNGTHTFYTNGDFGTGTVKMQIAANGNVGIGTVTPTGKLTVNGDIFTTASVATTTADIRNLSNLGGLRIYSSENILTSTPDSAVIQIYGSASALTGRVYIDAASNNNGGIYLRTAPTAGSITERMVIDATGSVGLGTTSPITPLHIKLAGVGGGNDILRLQGSDTWISFHNTASVSGRGSSTNREAWVGFGSGAGTNAFGITNEKGGGAVFIINNRFGVNLNNPSYELQISTDSAAKPSTNTWTISSDIRVKENIQPYTKGLESILQINPATYDYNGKAGFSKIKNNIGVIAQDVLNILPECISTYKAKLNEEDTEETELYNFNSHAITYILINSVKQLKAENDSLKQRMELLENTLLSSSNQSGSQP